MFGGKMNFHDIGDKLESICRQVLLNRWQNSQIIETKRNSIHGIDFAVEIIGNGIMIVEVKSATGSVRNGQMDIEWIRKNLTPSFKKALQEAYQKRYYLGCATYRVVQVYGDREYHFQDNQGQKYLVKNAPPTRKIDWNDLLNDIFPIKSNYDKLDSELSKIESEYSTSLVEAFVGKEIDFNKVRESLKLLQGDIHKTILTKEFKKKLIDRVQKSFEKVGDLQNKEKEKKQQDWQKQQEERKYNYKLKHDICLSIESISTSDWKIAGNRIKELQQKWKSIGSVPKDRADEINDRYRSACDNFFQKRQRYFDELNKERENQQKERERNYSLKRDICLSIESISTSDWKIAGNRIKELQQKWKSIGSVPKDRADEINDRYRSACDNFFQKRQRYFDELNKERENQQKERERNYSLKRDICLSIESISTSDWKIAGNRIKELQQKWKSIGSVPKDRADEINDRYRSACDNFFQKRQRYFDELSKERERKQKEWEERQRERQKEKERKQREYEERQRERERKQREYEERRRERERKQREYEERQRNKRR
ncbi:hypothetical protein DQF64_09840 [Moraxella bovis]|nr:hypothetical protein DQF64_09840 [Moraxella bovis]